MMSKFIPYGKQYIDDDDIQSVVEALKSDYLTTGPKIEEFEKVLAEYTGAKYAVAISNGTAALHAACFAAGVGEGDEVITSPMTFAASANCTLYMGAKPVFADIDPLTYNIDPNDIRKKITKKTKALIPVHFTGQPCHMDEIINIAKEYGIAVIEDGAHALGADYKGKKVGNIGDMTTFSFHPVKHITTGEGGAILTNDGKLYEKLVMFRTHGITRNPAIMTKNQGGWYYEQQFLGYNFRMTDIQAALGISQMKKLDFFLSRRREIANIYNKAFAVCEGVIIPYQAEYGVSAWHLYVIKLDSKKLNAGRKEIFDALRSRKIGVNVHYIPVYYHPYYVGLGYKKGICKNAEELYERIISLPLYPGMSDDDVQYVIVNLIDIICKYNLETR